MDTPVARTSTHPMVVIAAVAVTLLSAAGIAAIMGWVPNSNSQQAASAIEAPKAAVVVAEPARPAEPVKAAEAPKPAPVAKPKVVAKAEPRHEAKHDVHAVANAEQKPVEYSPPVQVAAAPAPAPAPTKQVCLDCGVIESVQAVEKAGEGSGLGAVAGGIAGAVLGRQVGGGRGRDIMTVVGAVGGGVAGHQIEKQVKKSKHYDITVRFEDGTTRVLSQDTEPAWRAGDKVRVNNGVISSNG